MNLDARLDAFFRQQKIDIGKSFALILVVIAIFKFYSFVGALLNRSHLALSFTTPLLLVLAYGLWTHRSWARTLLLLYAWGALLSSVVIAGTFAVQSGDGTITIALGAEKFKTGSVGVALVALGLLIPVLIAQLACLHSRKAVEEFRA